MGADNVSVADKVAMHLSCRIATAAGHVGAVAIAMKFIAGLLFQGIENRK
jgi:hypothetical protein